MEIRIIGPQERYNEELLEAKLELLHRCLVPSDSPDVLPEILSKNEEGEKYLKAYSAFITQRNKCLKNEEKNFIDDDKGNGMFSTAYIKALTELRNVILDS